MAILSEEQVQGVVAKFHPYFLRKKLMASAAGEEIPKVSFDEFLSSDEEQYEQFKVDLERSAEELCCSEAKYVLDRMSEAQRTLLGSLFESLDLNFVPYTPRQQTVMDEVVLSDKDLRRYRRDMQPYLSQEQHKHIVRKLAEMLYARMSEDEKKELSQKKVETYILGLGFLRLPRGNHREALDFIVEYNPLFKGETEVLLRIAERYMDEELAKTPIDQTEQRIVELEDEVIKLYLEISENEA